MSLRQRFQCLILLVALLLVGSDAQLHLSARRMLLGADSADAIDSSEQYAGCAGPPYCPMDSSYWFCYKNSVRCAMPNCAGCSPCCTDIEEKKPDPPSPIDPGQSIRIDDWPNPPKPVPEWVDIHNGNDLGKPCWDNRNQKWANDKSMFSCAKGGTRMCTNGEWRVTQGECTAEEALIVNDQGQTQPVVLVGSSYKGGKRHLLAEQSAAAVSSTQVQNQGLRCEASAGCPMDQTYWLCWPSSYRCALEACKGCDPCCTGNFKPLDDPNDPNQKPCWDDGMKQYYDVGTVQGCRLGGKRQCYGGVWYRVEGVCYAGELGPFKY